MLSGIQIVGGLFGLFMCFLTFLHFKKNNFGPKSLFVWMCIWVGFLSLVFYPQGLYGLMNVLSITRTIDIFVVFGFFLFTVIIFYMYLIVKKSESKVEELVRKLALNGKTRKKKSI